VGRDGDILSPARFEHRPQPFELPIQTNYRESLPAPADGVAPYRRVGGENCGAFYQGGGDEQAVEGVNVVVIKFLR